MSLLSAGEIRQHLRKGIIIEPFDPELLKSCSYDVRLGESYFRRRTEIDSTDCLFNPYDAETVRHHYEGPLEAQPATTFDEFHRGKWKFIDPGDLIIPVKPLDLLLCHTEEFIGGTKCPKTGRCFTAEMKARSSVGRVGFEVCRCAGWGDVGYVNRWTMEIVCTINCPPNYIIPLVVGTRLAQMKFYEVAPVPDEMMYGYDPDRDHYQFGTDIAKIIENWYVEMLLPRLTKR